VVGGAAVPVGVFRSRLQGDAVEGLVVDAAKGLKKLCDGRDRQARLLASCRFLCARSQDVDTAR
jgi:hypothetical protein